MKMFKGTNKLWKGLALVLALCMISTVAYAEGESATPQTANVTLTTTSYDSATQTVTIAGTIDVPGNDVTILAVRGGAAYSALADVWTEDMLPSKVVYIDQKTSNKNTGAFSFSFKPRADVIGGVISVFVGGEDVATVAPWSVEDKKDAPTLVLPEVWYEGTTTLDITLGGEYADADLWGNAINAVTITPENADVEWDYADGKVTLTGFGTTGESLTKIVITTEDNAFEDAVWENTLAQAAKNLGGNVLSVGEDYFAVAGRKAAITVTTDDEAWKEALTSYVYVGTATEPEDLGSEAFNGTTLSVPVDIANKAENLTETVRVAVKQNYYVEEYVDVTVVAPTKAAADAAEIEWEYSATTDDAGTGTAAAKEADSDATAEELKNRYGAAIVTLPTPEAGYTYSWTAVSADEGAAEITIANDAASVTLDRPDYEEEPTEESPQSYTYTLTLTVSYGDYADSEATEVARITVSRVGMKGVPVAAAPSFGGNEQQSAAIAADATATLTGATGDIALTWDSEAGSFKGENVAPGEYTITVVRPGFLVGSSTITVGADGQITGTMPEMIAGDSNGDGTIDISDVAAAVTVWDSETTYADLNADGVVDISDVAIIVSNWDATGVGTGSLE